MIKPLSLVGLSALLLAGNLQAEKPDPIYGPLFKGMSDGVVMPEGVTRFATKYIHLERDTMRKGTNDVSNPKGVSVTVDKGVIALRHGVAKGMEVELVAPFTNKDFTINGESAENFSPEDIKLKARFSIFDESLPKGMKAAVGGGVKIPSGDTGSSSQSTVEAKTRNGTGSFDYIVDTGLTGRTPHSRYDVYLTYTMTTEGAYDTKAGDSFMFNADYFYSFHPAWNLGGELTYEWVDKSEVNGVENDNTGYTTAWFTPQVQFLPKPNWDLVAGAAIPFHDDINGQQLAHEPIFIVRLGTKF